ncbi:M1-specific T cell receptor alpha chain-like [Limanda limanda]|uniref:M1-specific T cell receptor alpha chain-like n=1 Tax=Limanda limanda TaxID=27771 RepID=UPI0029C96005|nr:M1-specific T cell receptor alpha chain-like [Limanda limanda]
MALIIFIIFISIFIRIRARLHSLLLCKDLYEVKCSSCSDELHCVTASGSRRLLFGPGIKVTVGNRDDYEPSYYELEDKTGTVRACLATGFSRNNATQENDLFRNHTAANSSRAVRAPDDSLHSEVLLLSEDHRGKCDPEENDSGVCVDTLDKDVTVNTVSLLVVALRLLFLKTVVFNVLMTLRLWLRH